MILRQEEQSPLSDFFDKNHIATAFKIVNDMSSDNVVDTDFLKESCNQTIKLLNDYVKFIEKTEAQEVKKSNIDRFKERLHQYDALGD